MAGPSPKWDTQYQWKAVTLLALGFGLVGLDRWIVAPLFPFMAKDLGLDYQAIGNLVGALGLVWGVFAIVSGRLSDSIGHRRVLVPAILLFSLMSGLSGAAAGFGSLLLVRGMMGLFEGSYCPTSFAATAAAAHPSRRGLLQGLQQSGFALFGFGLGPIIATQLLLVVPSWRWVFWIVAIPGFVVGLLLWIVLREPQATQGGAAIGASGAPQHAGWGQVLKSKNILLCMLGLAAAMSCIFVLGGMLPSYLTDYLKLTPQQMGFVASALGFGGFLGQFAVPGVSDVLGRRPTAILGFLGAAAGGLVRAEGWSRPLDAFQRRIPCVDVFARKRGLDHGTDRNRISARRSGVVRDWRGRRLGRDLRWRHCASHRRDHRAELRDREHLLDAVRGSDDGRRCGALPHGDCAATAGGRTNRSSAATVVTDNRAWIRYSA